MDVSENYPNGGILKPNDLLVAPDLWRRKDLRNSIKVKKAAFGGTLSSSNYGS